MSVLLKCAACGAEVKFEELTPTVEETCPGCEVRVRYREGDQQMAIPVSMTLPDEFQHVDLDSVAVKSSLLVSRSRKPTAEPPADATSEVILAKALETLVNSISHLEERLDRREGDVTVVEPNVGNGHPDSLKELSKNGADEKESEVVQLAPEEEEEPKFRGKSKANPVGAQVLVRREAAREAHEFRREKHSQSDWDDFATPDKRVAGFGWLMENFPKTTVIVSLLLVVALTTATIVWMDDLFSNEGAVAGSLPQVRITALGQLKKDDPEAALAETVARAYLNATSVKTAAPFVYESEAIREKFEQFYRPIAKPGSYGLSLKQRAIGDDGKPQFLYRVTIPGEKDRRLVVLPEGKMPKVFWEFFAEVGDTSWGGFLKSQSREPLEMRVWVYPGEKYIEGYNPKDWQSYVLHDYAEKNLIYAFADRGAGEDWRITDELENAPVKFNRHSAVMALVKLTYMTKRTTGDGAEITFAVIKEVISTSWLPERFRAKKSKER
ncbi:MAG: hypothetical protein VCA34_02040 [Roseibacillus sp.]